MWDLLIKTLTIIATVAMVIMFFVVAVGVFSKLELKPITAQEMPDGYICFRIEDMALSCLKRNR